MQSLRKCAVNYGRQLAPPQAAGSAATFRTCSAGSSGTQAPPTARAASRAASSWRSSAARSRPKMWGSWDWACWEVNTRKLTSRLHGGQGATGRQAEKRNEPGGRKEAQGEQGQQDSKQCDTPRWQLGRPCRRRAGGQAGTSSTHLWLALVLPKVGGRRGRRYSVSSSSTPPRSTNSLQYRTVQGAVQISSAHLEREGKSPFCGTQ